MVNSVLWISVKRAHLELDLAPHLTHPPCNASVQWAVQIAWKAWSFAIRLHTEILNNIQLGLKIPNVVKKFKNLCWKNRGYFTHSHLYWNRNSAFLEHASKSPYFFSLATRTSQKDQFIFGRASSGADGGLSRSPPPFHYRKWVRSDLPFLQMSWWAV